VSGGHRALLSFPTRRSSDLGVRAVRGDVVVVELADLGAGRRPEAVERPALALGVLGAARHHRLAVGGDDDLVGEEPVGGDGAVGDRKSTRLNSSHVKKSYAV